MGANSASSQESRTKLIENKKFEDSHKLTDAKLKADAGSLSQLSVKGSLSYFGPTFGDFKAADQPNPDGSVGSFAQAIKGALSMRYRISPDQTVSAGTGIAIIHPFHGWDRTDANNPFLSYDFSSRYGALQMRNSPGLVVTTVPNYTTTGQVGGVSWDNSLVYGFGFSRLALSLDTGVNYWHFSRDYRPGSIRSGGDGKAQQYSISMYPGAKYNANDKLNIYSSLGFQLFNPREKDLDVLWNRSVSLRLGAGYALTRDVYIAPYVQGFATNLAWDMMTINMTGVFSVL